VEENDEDGDLHCVNAREDGETRAVVALTGARGGGLTELVGGINICEVAVVVAEVVVEGLAPGPGAAQRLALLDGHRPELLVCTDQRYFVNRQECQAHTEKRPPDRDHMTTKNPRSLRSAGKNRA
jgi:hypothetical protein